MHKMYAQTERAKKSPKRMSFASILGLFWIILGDSQYLWGNFRVIQLAVKYLQVVFKFTRQINI